MCWSGITQAGTNTWWTGILQFFLPSFGMHNCTLTGNYRLPYNGNNNNKRPLTPKSMPHNGNMRCLIGIIGLPQYLNNKYDISYLSRGPRWFGSHAKVVKSLVGGCSSSEWLLPSVITIWPLIKHEHTVVCYSRPNRRPIITCTSSGAAAAS